MEYNPSDSSGTDDDLPPTLQNRGARGGRAPGNGRTPVMGSLPHARMHGDMETQIHQLEQEAYCSVLLAFKAQSDAITWEKESLITELRKELKVSDKEHRKLLNQVNADDIIRRIREWRQAGGPHSGLLSNTQSVHNGGLSPTASASRKKQKTSQTRPSVSPALHSQAVAASVQPSSSAAKRGAAPIAVRGKKQNSGQMLPSGSSIKSTQYPSAVPAGRGQVANRPPPGAHLPVEPAEAAKFDPLIGRKVLTRWPEDNNFYEAVITDYNPTEGLHALVYDINTKDETWEWVNLKEISPEDIRWEGEEPGIAHRSGRGVPGRGGKKSMGRGGAVPGTGKGRGSLKHPLKKDFPPTQNGIGKKGCDIIEILHTDTLIKEVEKAFGSGHPDPFDVEKAKKVLKEHEQSLIDAITRLADASDGESGTTAASYLNFFFLVTRQRMHALPMLPKQKNIAGVFKWTIFFFFSQKRVSIRSLQIEDSEVEESASTGGRGHQHHHQHQPFYEDMAEVGGRLLGRGELPRYYVQMTDHLG